MLAATAQRLAAEAQAVTVPVWPENWHAVQLFMALQTQWQWVGGPAGSRRVGLRYEALPTVLPAVKRSVSRPCRQPYASLLGQLQHLEFTALAAIAQSPAQSLAQESGNP